MRLIDADDLEKRVRNSSIRSKRSTTELIRDSKTVYNVNRVVRCVNDLLNSFCNCDNDCDGCSYNHLIDSIIEEIKNGGILKGEET